MGRGGRGRGRWGGEWGRWYWGRALGRWPGRGAEVRVALALAEYNAGLGNVLRWLPRRGEMGNAAGGGGGGGGGELTAEGVVGGVTWPGVRDYVREVMEDWRMYRERGYL